MMLRIAALAVTLTACSGSPAGVDAAVDGDGGGIDAEPADACIASGCGLLATYGDLGRLYGSATEGDLPLTWEARFVDDCGAETVLARIVLIDGNGVFAGGIAPGSYTLAGAELDPGTCGACVSVDANQGGDHRCYLATAGTLRLTSVVTDLTGWLEGADFARVDCASFAPMGSCAAAIERISFDDPIVPTI